MSSEAGSAVLAAVFAYPKDVDERRTRIYYGGVFILAKSVALSLALIPPSDEVQKLLFGLSIVNLVLSFVLDACARRETKKWAGETGQETQFFHCLLETVIGSWATHKVLDTSKRAYTRKKHPQRAFAVQCSLLSTHPCIFLCQLTERKLTKIDKRGSIPRRGQA